MSPAAEQHLWLAVDSSRADYFHKTGSSADPYTILLRRLLQSVGMGFVQLGMPSDVAIFLVLCSTAQPSA